MLARSAVGELIPAHAAAASRTTPRPPAPPPPVTVYARAQAALGAGALATAVAAAVWIAAGAAAGTTWLQLPSHSAPGWVTGPLHGLWRLSPGALSAGLIVLGVSYLVALACARAISLRAALGAVALASLAFTLGPTIVSSDVFGYIAYARELAQHGLNPYVSAPSSLGHDAILPFVYWTHQPSPYGPLFTVVSAPLGLLSSSAALWGFKALAGLASVSIAVLVAQIASRRGQDGARAAIFVGLNPVLLFYAVSGAHNDLLAVALVVGAMALVAHERAGPGARAAVAAAAVKVTLGLALPLVVILAGRRERRRGASAAGLAVAAVAIPSLVVFGPHLLDQLHRITTDARFDVSWSGPDLLARAFGTHITTGLRTLCTAAAGVLALGMGARAWRGTDPIAAAGWAFAGLLASIASLAPWYLVWLLPFAALGRSRGLRVATLLLTGYLLAVHLPALGAAPWLTGP